MKAPDAMLGSNCSPEFRKWPLPTPSHSSLGAQVTGTLASSPPSPFSSPCSIPFSILLQSEPLAAATLPQTSDAFIEHNCRMNSSDYFRHSHTVGEILI